MADDDGGTNKELNASGNARGKRDLHAACHQGAGIFTALSYEDLDAEEKKKVSVDKWFKKKQ